MKVHDEQSSCLNTFLLCFSSDARRKTLYMIWLGCFVMPGTQCKCFRFQMWWWCFKWWQPGSSWSHCARHLASDLTAWWRLG